MSNSRIDKAYDELDDELIELIHAAHDMCEVGWEREHCEEGSPGLRLYKALDAMGWVVEENKDE